MNTQKDLFKKCVQVCVRAEKLGVAIGERIDRIMDVENAVNAFNIDIDRWMEADDFNFAHDYKGIVENINRNLGVEHKYSSEDFACFVPRFAQQSLPQKEGKVSPREVIREARDVAKGASVPQKESKAVVGR